jgi:solute carrier family 13 (sodium-dependent dicarboxylate transporter), member 2/3/5
MIDDEGRPYSRLEQAPERGGPWTRRIGFTLGLASFCFLLFWPGLPLDGQQRSVAAVTALTATWWLTLTLPIAATSILPAALFPLLGVMRAGEVAPVYMHDLVMLFLGAFVVALGLERWGVHRRIALWIIQRVGTEPSRLVLGFMIAAGFLSMWISNTATTLLMLPIALAVIHSVRIPDSAGKSARRFTLCLLLGIAYSASIGGTGTPVGTAPNQVFLGIFQEKFPEAPQISFGQWFFGFAPLALLFIPLAWLLMTRVLLPLPRGLRGGGESIRQEREAQGRMSRGQVMMSIVFGTTALLWITRADLDFGVLSFPGWSRLFLPAGESAAEHAKDISDSTVALVMAALCFILPVKPREGIWLMDWRCASRLPWEVLLLLGGGFCLARGFQVSELDVLLGRELAPLLGGLPGWAVVFAVALFMSFLTELTSNTATTAVLLPVAATAAAAGGINPLLLMVPATIAASAAFMMPVATPPNAVVFGSRMVPPAMMARTGFALNMLAVILLTLLFEFWVKPLWKISEAVPEWALP